MEDSNYIVNGFKYDNKDEFYKAQKEAETIEYIRAKTDLKNIKTVAKLYANLIQKESFHTLVGYCFLQELRMILVNAKVVSVDKIPTIPMDQFRGAEGTPSTSHEMAKDRLKQEKTKVENELVDAKLRVKRHRIINIALVVIVVAMFIITAFSDNSPFEDAETKVLNQYSEWQQNLKSLEEELDQRADDLEERERALNEKGK